MHTDTGSALHIDCTYRLLLNAVCVALSMDAAGQAYVARASKEHVQLVWAACLDEQEVPAASALCAAARAPARACDENKRMMRLACHLISNCTLLQRAPITTDHYIYNESSLPWYCFSLYAPLQRHQGKHKRHLFLYREALHVIASGFDHCGHIPMVSAQLSTSLTCRFHAAKPLLPKHSEHSHVQKLTAGARAPGVF